MEQPIRFYDCKDFSDPNKRVPIDANTLEDFSKAFDLLAVLGKGRYGVVCATIEDHIALKIMCYQSIDDKGTPFSDNEENEMHILCLLNELVDTAYIFPRVYGWMIMSTLPNRWYEKLENVMDDNMQQSIYEKAPFLCVCMEKIDFKLKKDLFLDEDDIRCMVFMLLYGIAYARKHLGHFRHRDIHFGNIMLSSVDPKAEFVFEDTPWSMTDIRFIPKLIDFGLSRKSEERIHFYDSSEDEDRSFFDADKVKYPARNDIRRIVGIVNTLYKERNFDQKYFGAFVDSDEFQDVMYSKRDEYSGLFKLLNHQYFECDKLMLRKRVKSDLWDATKKQNDFLGLNLTCVPQVRFKCITCYSSSPGLLYDTNVTFQFCNEQCASKFETFRRFAPIRFKK